MDEIIIVSNRGDLNFEGDLAIPMPKISGFKLLSSNLDFLDFFISDGKLVFESLLVADNSSGSIRIAYILEGDTMERKLAGEKVLLIPLAEVEDFKNLEIAFVGGQKVYEGIGSYWIKFRFSSFQFAHIAIFIASLALFLILLSNRGGWK
uniref:Uncharacterized protein n=1 Tax=Archaeoglobus fulgidus TaxID=2234 RepID=A0A7J2TJV3_ARCFL